MPHFQKEMGRQSCFAGVTFENTEKCQNFPDNMIRYDGEPQGKLVGIYTQRERLHKINKYKAKLQRWKDANKDAFNGRSRVAKKKLRYFGRFIKSEDFKDKILSDDQIVKNNLEIDSVVTKGDYNTLVDIITRNPSDIK